MHNFHEMAACAPDLVGVNFFPGGQLYEDSGPRWFIYNTLPLCRLLIDGRQYESSSCRWYAYQAERRAKAGDLEVLSTNRLVMEDTIVLWRLKLTNTGSAEKSFHIGVAADGELKHTAAGPEIRAVALLDEVVDHFAGGGARLRVVSPNSLRPGYEVEDDRDLSLFGWGRGEAGRAGGAMDDSPAARREPRDSLSDECRPI